MPPDLQAWSYGDRPLVQKLRSGSLPGLGRIAISQQPGLKIAPCKHRKTCH